MSFGAVAAWQAWFIIAGAAAAAWWLFRLKVRPPRVGVPSLILWRHVIGRPSERSWWARVRRAASLSVTVLVAVLLAAAVTRPGPRASATSGGRLLIVLDSSWSMRARTAEGDTRWSRAIAGARALAESAGADVAIATTADGLVEGPTSDAALVAAALERLVPAGGDSITWPRVDGVSATHFFTDGAVPRSIAPDTVVHSVFSPAGNVAVTALGVRPAISSSTTPSAYLEVANYADRTQRAHVTVTRGAAPIADRWVDLAPGEVSRQVLNLEAAGGGALRARVAADENALDIDDEAVAWLAAGDPIRVAVVSEAPAVWADLLGDDPGVDLSFVRPAAFGPAVADVDVFIFDRWAPPAAPGRPALLFAPPASSWLGRPDRDELLPVWADATEHPILDGVEPLTLDIARVRRYGARSIRPIARSAGGTPLVSVIDAPDVRGVLVGFSPAESNLASARAFPILVGNVLDWLARPAAGDVRPPGPMALPAGTTRVTSPDGEAVPLVRSGDRVLARLRTPGLYLVEAGGSRSVVGVNAGDPTVANLMRTHLSGRERRADAAGLAARPWWAYAIALAVVLLAVEWWTWLRRITV